MPPPRGRGGFKGKGKGKGRDGNTLVGFEFAAHESNFWHMTFTVPGAKPLRRITPFKVSA